MTKVLKKRPPSPLAERIRNRMLALGISQAELARRAKTTPVFLSELLRGAKQTMKPDRLRDFAIALDVSTDYLVGVMQPARLPPLTNPEVPHTYSQQELADWAASDEEQRIADRDGSRQNTLAQMYRRRKYVSFRPAGSIEAPIPVFGKTVGELIIINASAEDAVDRPPLLRWNDGAYTVIADGSMSPRYNSGEILYVAPGITVRDGDYVVVVTRSERDPGLFGRICRLKTVTDTHVLVETFSPQKSETLALDTVAHIHRIVAAGQRSLD